MPALALTNVYIKKIASPEREYRNKVTVAKYWRTGEKSGSNTLKSINALEWLLC
jgi:hypothetical protein